MPFSTLSRKHLDPKYPQPVLVQLWLFCGDSSFYRSSGFGSNASGVDTYVAPSSGAAYSSGGSIGSSAPGSGKYAGFGNPEFQGKDRSGSIDMQSLQDSAAKAMTFMADGLTKLKGKLDENTKQPPSSSIGSSSLYQNPSTQVPTIVPCFCELNFFVNRFSSQLLVLSLLVVVAHPHTTLGVLIEVATVTTRLQRRLAQPMALTEFPNRAAAAWRPNPVVITKAKLWRQLRSQLA